jgi:hypothetical protein
MLSLFKYICMLAYHGLHVFLTLYMTNADLKLNLNSFSLYANLTILNVCEKLAVNSELSKKAFQFI